MARRRVPGAVVTMMRTGWRGQSLAAPAVSACVIAITVVALVALDRAWGLERLLVGRSADGR